MPHDDKVPLSILDEFLATSTGYDVMRYISLPDIFGDEAHTLLYFTGRRLARKLDIKTKDDIYYAFQKLSWGQLELTKERKRSMSFYLMSDEVVKRITAPITVDFRLESGFLAEAIQKIMNRPCECKERVNKRLYRVQFEIIFTDI